MPTCVRNNEPAEQEPQHQMTRRPVPVCANNDNWRGVREHDPTQELSKNKLSHACPSPRTSATPVPLSFADTRAASGSGKHPLKCTSRLANETNSSRSSSSANAAMVCGPDSLLVVHHGQPTRMQLTTTSRCTRREGEPSLASQPATGRPDYHHSAGPGPCRPVGLMLLASACLGLLLALGGPVQLGEARITFEKMTNRDYSGLNYYTIQNVSLFECLGWCKEESSCTSAVFSFVVNPFAALQETTCMLQNETQARQGAYLRTSSNGEQLTVVAQPQKATNLYFFNKIELQTESVCARLWAFERFPNRRLRARDRGQPFHSGTKEACQAACMNEQRFVCRSLEFNYINQQCTLSAYDRRSPLTIHLTNQSLGAIGNNNNNNNNINHHHHSHHHSHHHGSTHLASSAGSGPASGGSSDLIDSPGTDYFENACLLGEDICNESRIYDYAKVGLPLQRVAHFVELNYYPDKEMLVKSQAGCVRACTIEHEFICRSILYRSTFKQGQPNCALYHLDQRTFPEGSDAFAVNVMQPLLDSGETSAVYLEAVCNDTIVIQPQQSGMLTTITTTTSSLANQLDRGGSSITMPPTSITIIPSTTTPGAMSVYPSGSSTLASNMLANNHTTSSDLERFVLASSSSSSSSSTLSPPTTIRLPATSSGFLGSSAGPQMPPANIQIEGNLMGGSSIRQPPMVPTHITISPSQQQQGQIHVQASSSSSSSSSSRPQVPSHLTISPAPPPNAGPQRDSSMILDPGASSSSLQISASGGLNGANNHDQNCDSHGFCYDVALKCTDTKMVVNVKTQRPFHGRIYALGRSETCNANIKNQNQFQLDMYLTGQECNTQSMSGTYTNTIVLQHHNVVLTKADKVYHVRCTYETASRNVSFGMMPVKDMFEVESTDRNPETISITASSDAPLPKISILTMEGKEANTVRIGDRLTFRIEIPDNTPYGIFARSCIAMAKDARSTFEIVDEHGCPVDHTIFPNFLPVSNGNALESNYEAFRFTESYGVIFQCNVKYCIGKCEPVNCGIGRDSVEAWGRRKRSIKEPKGGSGGKQLGDDMTLSHEIVVLDLKDKTSANNDDSNAYDNNGDNNGGNNNHLHAGDQLAQKSPLSSINHNNHQLESTSQLEDPNQILGEAGKYQMHCLSSQSLLLVICAIGLFFVLYVCLVAYFFARRDAKISVIKQQYH